MRNLRTTVLAIAVASVLVIPLGAGPAASACDSDNDCPPSTPFCDVDTCIECFLDDDCSPSAPRCNTGPGSCEACSVDADCTRFPALPACTAAGACAECSASNQDRCSGTTPACNAAAGNCVPCSSDADCTASPAGPACLGDGSCGPDVPTCDAAPLDSCGEAASSQLRIASSDRIARNKMQWSWLEGSIALGDLGDPMTSTDYAFCLYRDSSLLFEAGIRRGTSHWRWTGKGFRYRNRDNRQGLQRLTLLSGAGGAKVVLRGKGIFLAVPELPIDGAPVDLQLVRHPRVPGACWSSTFSPPYAADTPTAFKARTSR